MTTIPEKIDSWALEAGQVAGRLMGMNAVRELAVDFIRPSVPTRSGSTTPGLFGRLMGVVALGTTLWQTGRAVSKCLGAGEIDDENRAILVGGLFASANLAVFQMTLTSRIAIVRGATLLFGLVTDLKRLCETVQGGASSELIATQVLFLIAFNFGRRERNFVKGVFNEPILTLPERRVLAPADRKVPIRAVFPSQSRRSALYTEVQREIRNERRHLIKEEQRLSPGGPEAESLKVKLRERKAHLTELELGLVQLRQHRLNAYYDVIEGEPCLRVMMEDGVYIHKPGQLQKIDSARVVHLLSSDGLKFSAEELAGMAEDQHGILHQGRIFNAEPGGLFRDRFGNELRRVGQDSNLIEILPEIRPFAPRINRVGSGWTFYEGERVPIRSFSGGNSLYVIQSNSARRVPKALVEFDFETHSLRYKQGVLFDPDHSDIFFRDGLPYKVTHTTRARGGAGTLYQAVGLHDRSRSAVFFRRPDGSIQMVQKVVRLEGELGRKNEIFLSYEGNTYAVANEGDGILFARHLGGNGGVADNWIVVRGDKPLSEVRIESFRHLTRGELIAEHDRTLRRISGLSNEGPHPFGEIPSPRELVVEPAGVVSWKGNGHLASVVEVELVRYRCEADGQKFELLLPPESQAVWGRSFWATLLKGLPRNALAGQQKVVVLPAGRALMLKDGSSVPSYYDYTSETVVIRDGLDPKTTHRALFHEIRGHGKERGNLEIEKATVLTMKIDRKTINDVAATDVEEYLPEGDWYLLFQPHVRSFHPALLKLCHALERVPSDRIAVLSRFLAA